MPAKQHTGPIFYRVTATITVNLAYLHSMAMNEDGEKGWLRMEKELNGKLVVYPITPLQFAEINALLFGKPKK